MRFLASVNGNVLVAGLLMGGLMLLARPAADGPGLFKANCSMCHGTDGKGFQALKTPDFTDPKWQASVTDKQITEVIKNGKKDTAMPAFEGKLKNEEILALVAYVRSFGSKKK